MIAPPCPGIAEAMGGSKGTLWSYFDSKEALFEAMIDRGSRKFPDRLDKLRSILRASPKRPCATLPKVSSARSRALMPSRCIGSSWAESPRFPELGQSSIARAPGAMREMLAGYIASQMNAGTLRRDDPTKAAAMFVALCDGGHHKRVLWGVEPYSDAAGKDEAEVAVEHFLRGLWAKLLTTATAERGRRAST